MDDVEQAQQMVPLITCVKFPFVRISASWFLVSMYLMSLGIQIDSIKQPIQELCGFWKHVSL